MSSPRTRVYGWRIVAVAYACALVVAALTMRLLPADLHPLVAVAIADVVATVVVFGWSVAHDNSSLYDPYWSVAPLVIAPWLALHPLAIGAVGLRQALVLAFVFGWGLRLTFNWLRHWQGLGHEDWRYVNLRRTTGRAYWMVSLLGLHLMPTAMVLGGCLAMWPALVEGTAPLGWIDGAAALTCAMALTVETVADRQLHDFREARHPTGTILETGLWGWSRHPNYFGEIMWWWGLWLFGWAAAAGPWWTGLGPVAISALFALVSIPMIERRMAARRPGWPRHCERVSVLVPWPPRRSR